MTMEHKFAYQFGIISGRLTHIQDDLVMGNDKDARTKLNDLIKYMDTDISPQFYTNELSTTKEDVSNGKTEESNTNDPGIHYQVTEFIPEDLCNIEQRDC